MEMYRLGFLWGLTLATLVALSVFIAMDHTKRLK
jgi:hypothetical protein